MTLELRLALQGRLVDFYRGEAEAGARGCTVGMNDTVESGKNFARQQVVSAGLGQRLANTWRGQTYPHRSGVYSMEPAGLLFNKAPDIIHGYAHGGTIVPVNGKRYLAIPTSYALKIVPTLVGNMRRSKKVNPQRLADHLGIRLVVRRNRHGTVWLEGRGLRLSRSKKSTRAGTAKKASDKMIAKGKDLALPLFWLVPQARIAKKLDLPAIEAHMLNQVEANVLRRWQEFAPRA